MKDLSYKKTVLHTFILMKNIHYYYFNDTFELILQNPDFICELNFNLNTGVDQITITDLMKFSNLIRSNCHSISNLYYGFINILYIS